MPFPCTSTDSAKCWTTVPTDACKMPTPGGRRVYEKICQDTSLSDDQKRQKIADIFGKKEIGSVYRERYWKTYSKPYVNYVNSHLSNLNVSAWTGSFHY